MDIKFKNGLSVSIPNTEKFEEAVMKGKFFEAYRQLKKIDELGGSSIEDVPYDYE